MDMSSIRVSPGGGINRPRPATADRAHAAVMVASEFIDELSSAESINLRERLGRLEASIAFWATDLDELNAENERVCTERDELKLRLQEMEDGKLDAEEARTTIEVVLDDRDQRINILETGLLEAERRSMEAHTTRTRMQALRKRVRDRMTAQSGEIDDLRRMVQLGHAARIQVERELQRMNDDARRDARYLDRLENKLRTSEGE